MWLVEENEAHFLADLKEKGLENDGGRWKIGCFLGSEAANYKTNLTMKLNKFSFYPDSYAMPKEMERFKNGELSLVPGVVTMVLLYHFSKKSVLILIKIGEYLSVIARSKA